MKLVNPDAIPLMIVWKELVVVASAFEVIIDDVDTTPFTVEVRTFAAAERLFPLMKLAVVVAITPFTTEVSTKSLVVVEMARVCDVPAFMIDCRSVLVETPLIVVVRIVPEAESALELMMVDVETEPPTFEVIVLTEDDKVLGTERFVIVAFVITELVEVEF